jgi:deoxyribonuclease NucA/NucB
MTSRIWAALATAALLLTGCAEQAETTVSGTLTISLARYPNVGDHARDAIAAGESGVCTIDRKGAALRRKDSLRGIATAPGKDRDEFPPAICLEGGKGADVRLVPAKENRSEGAWMSGQLAKWPDGTRIRITVSN